MRNDKKMDKARKQAVWKYNPDAVWGDWTYYCTSCSAHGASVWNYCPVCGAEMTDVDDEAMGDEPSN